MNTLTWSSIFPKENLPIELTYLLLKLCVLIFTAICPIFTYILTTRRDSWKVISLLPGWEKRKGYITGLSFSLKSSREKQNKTKPLQQNAKFPGASLCGCLCVCSGPSVDTQEMFLEYPLRVRHYPMSWGYNSNQGLYRPVPLQSGRLFWVSVFQEAV